jgi:hypothetical protein
MNAMSLRPFGSARRLLMIIAILFAPVACVWRESSGIRRRARDSGPSGFAAGHDRSEWPPSFPLIGDVKAAGKLTVCLDILRDIDIGSAANHLAFVWPSYASTMLKSLRKLRPGHCAWIDADARLTSSDTKSPPAVALWASRTRD